MSRPTLIALLVLLLAAAPGCSTLNLSSLWGDKVIVADTRYPVTEVMCLWEEAEGTGLDGMPTRGFAGQILFFTSDKKQPSPMKVEGDVRVFVFDDEGVRGDKAQPIHQFDFPGAAWNAFMASTSFGTTYQLFIPYTKPGSHHADCEIRVRYTPAGGNPVFSRPCTVSLAGTPRPGAEGASARRQRRNASMIQQAGYETPADPVEGHPQVDTTSLRVAPSGSATAAAANTRSRAIQVGRLDHLANSLAEEAGIPRPPVTPAPSTGRAPSAVNTSAPDAAASNVSAPETVAPLRRRLNPLAAEAAGAPVGAKPEGEAVPSPFTESAPKHILLGE